MQDPVDGYTLMVAFFFYFPVVRKGRRAASGPRRTRSGGTGQNGRDAHQMRSV